MPHRRVRSAACPRSCPGEWCRSRGEGCRKARSGVARRLPSSTEASPPSPISHECARAYSQRTSVTAVRRTEEWIDGAQGRNRTTDTAIFSRMLYQLSYLGGREPAGLNPCPHPDQVDPAPARVHRSRGSGIRPGTTVRDRRLRNDGCKKGGTPSPLAGRRSGSVSLRFLQSPALASQVWINAEFQRPPGASLKLGERNRVALQRPGDRRCGTEHK